MMEYGSLILCDMGTCHSHSDWGSGHNLGCNKGGPWGRVRWVLEFNLFSTVDVMGICEK